MVAFATYRIIPQLKINLEYYAGPTYLDDLISVRKNLILEKELQTDFNFIVDLRDATFELHTNVVNDFIKYVKDTTNLLWNRKTAILSNTPNQTAFSILYMEDVGNVPMKIQSFYTLESAINWVDLFPADQSLVEKVILELKQL